MKPTTMLASIIVLTFTTTAAAVAAPLCHQTHRDRPSHEEIASRIDSLAELRLRLQGKEFANRDRFTQSLAYFDQEMAFLAEVAPDFERRYHQRYKELAQELKAQQKARKLQEAGKKKDRAKKMQEAAILNAHELFHVDMNGPVKNAQYSPNGKWIFGLSHLQVVIIDAATGKVRSRFETPDLKAPFKDAVFSPDSTFLAIATSEGNTLIVDVVSGQQVHSIPHGAPVTKVAFSPDSKLLLTTIGNGSLTTIDVNTGDKLYTIQNARSGLFSSDSNWILVSFQGDHTEKVLIDARKGETSRTLQETQGGGVLEFSPDLRFVLAGFGSDSIRILDSATGKNLLTISHDKTIWRAHFSPDSKFVATASYDGIAKIMDVDSGQIIHTIQHEGWVNDTIWSHDSQFVATVSEDGFAFIVDVNAKSTRYKIPHGDRVEKGILNSDSTLLVTAGYDKKVRIIDVVTGAVQDEIEHSRFINRISFSPDEKFLLSASDDGTLVVTKLYVSSEE